MVDDSLKTEGTSRIQPGIYLKKNILEKRGMTQKDLGKILGVSRQTINQLIAGSISLSPAMALRLSNTFGNSVDFWLNLDNDYNQINEEDDFVTKNEVAELWEARGARILVDHEIAAGVHAGIIGIKNFSIESVQPASYDLRAGKRAIISSDNNHTEIDVEQTSLVLEPKSTAVLQSYEWLKFPKWLLGRLGAMTDLSSNGILTLHGIQVDPGFEGHIYVTLHNVSSNKLVLGYQQPFMTMELNYLSVQPQSKYFGKNIKRTEFLASEMETVKVKKK